MLDISPYLTSIIQLQQQASHKRHRAVVVLDGPSHWATQLSDAFAKVWCDGREDDARFEAVSIGWAEGCPQFRNLSFKQARQLLGSECDLLLVDLSCDFDANGFNAACGALVGGGVLLLHRSAASASPSQRWLDEQLETLPVLRFADEQPISQTVLTRIPAVDQLEDRQSRNGAAELDLLDQQPLVGLVEQVAKGHRKRPLVVTADRGRGKSAGIGIAIAKLLAHTPLNVIVTAPSKSAVATLFGFLSEQQELPKSFDVVVGQGRVRFVAPDELYETKPIADLVVVDEASALPLPMLIALCNIYHRMIFSSTIHGYEGCGRGFTLKFMAWLDTHRPGWRGHSMKRPLRWAETDPLETWLSNVFFLDAEADSLVNPFANESLSVSTIDKIELLTKPKLLHSCVGLLVNAHYQTTPNDVFALLDDDAIALHVCYCSDSVVGVMLTVREGGLSRDLVSQVEIGQRRPPGHLVAANLANHFGLTDALCQQSLRVMRIAAHPDYQQRGVGSLLLSHLNACADPSVTYLSTSFGLTSELLSFWRGNGFEFIKLGSARDQASGTYSSIWIMPVSEINWISDARSMGQQQLLTQLSYETPLFESYLAAKLLKPNSLLALLNTDTRLIRHFAEGGNSVAAVRASVLKALSHWSLEELQVHQSSLIIDVFIKNLSNYDIVQANGLSGAKALNKAVREAVAAWLDLHCKLNP